MTLFCHWVRFYICALQFCIVMELLWTSEVRATLTPLYMQLHADCDSLFVFVSAGVEIVYRNSFMNCVAANLRICSQGPLNLLRQWGSSHIAHSNHCTCEVANFTCHRLVIVLHSWRREFDSQPETCRDWMSRSFPQLLYDSGIVTENEPSPLHS